MAQVYLIAFTEQGCRTAKDIARALESGENPHYTCTVAGPERFAAQCGINAYSNLTAWTREAFAQADGIVFVSAMGIAVRAIAPYVADKFADPAVVCVDEKAGFAIPLLSGHVGGANDLARAIADGVGATPVVSTATDVNGLFAVDQWAREHDMAIVERAAAKAISASLLSGESVGLMTPFDIAGYVPQGVYHVHEETAVDCGVGFEIALNAAQMPFAQTLHLIPRIVTVGVGCRRDTEPEKLEAAVTSALAQAGVDERAVRMVASIDIKADEPAIAQLVQKHSWDVQFFSADELAAVEGDFSSSDFVRETTGVDNVCERAAICAARDGALLLGKQAGDGVTVALAIDAFTVTFGNAQVPAAEGASSGGKPLLYVVGFGPGGGDGMTQRARNALEASDVIIGYTTYVKLIEDEFPDKLVKSTGMRKEVDRCRMALEEVSEGKTVAVVCSGDAGVYGMAGLCLELSDEFPSVEIRVIPGVTAALAGGAVLGAPLTHDFAVISLSDLLTPWKLIEKRLDAAAAADFCIALYNPSSHKRADYLQRACDILLRHKPPETICGTVQNIGREGEQGATYTLAELRDTKVDMFTTVFIGNAQTRLVGDAMVTPRGYKTRTDEPAGQ